MSGNAIEYFAVLGRKTGHLSPRLSRGIWGDTETVPPCEIWEDAITDIAIVRTGRGESCGEEWELVLMEGGEEEANCNSGSGDSSREQVHIAIMRRRTSKKDSHISDILVWQAGDPNLPESYALIHTSISGTHSGDLNVGGTQTFLAIRKTEDVGDALIHGTTILDDVSIFTTPKGGEELPDNYLIIDKNLNRGVRGEKLHLGFHQRSPMGICDMRYEYSTLDRYPVDDNHGLELPVNDLPMFTFPHDLRIKRCSKHDFPLPDFFTFVFTDVHGRHLHAACLRFYEVVPLSDVTDAYSDTFKKPKEDLVLEEEMEIVCPKVICVLSQMPFYRAMSRFLRQLYSLSLSPMVCPVEYFLTSTVAKVPLPLIGGRPLHIILDAALISIMSKAMAPISLELPSDRFFQPMDLDFAAPLRCLSVENLLAVFCLLLREEKVVFICRSNALLTEVMETFRSLLFPLRWSSCFITRLPDSLCALLEAPGGFMIGLHVTEHVRDRSTSGNENCVSFVKIGNKKYEKMGGWSSHIPSGSYIVDLSENSVLLLESRSHGVLNTSKVGSNGVKILPSGPRKRIEQKLHQIATAYAIGPQLSGLEQFDSPFEIQGNVSVDGSEGKNWENFPTLEIRDAFVVLMADILGNVALYTQLPSKNIDADEYRSFAEEFDIQRYINDSDKSCRQLLTQLLETQMFSVLLQTRSDGPDNTYLEFFESLSQVVHLTGLSALSSSDKRFESVDGHVPPLQLVDTPAPLFSLMSHYQRLVHTPSVHRAVKGIHSAGSSILRQFSGKANGYGNKLLDELMIHLLTPEFRPPAGDFAHMELDFNTLREKSRYELETVPVTFAMLQDTTKGPLLLPGPMYSIDRDGEDIQYVKYNDGWPVLCQDLLKDFSYCHPRLPDISSVKEEEYRKIRSFVLATIPSAEARISLLSASPLIYPVRHALTSATDQHSNSIAALSMVVDIYSLSITSLCLRAMSLGNPSEISLIGHIFEVFGVLAQVEGFGLLPFMEESVLRSVLIVCGCTPPSTYSDYSFFHAACCVVFDMIRIGANIPLPSTLTAGAYASSLSRFKTLQVKLKKKNEPANKEPRTSSYTHLQDIGVSWFASKSLQFYPEFSDPESFSQRIRIDADAVGMTPNDTTPEKSSPIMRDAALNLASAHTPNEHSSRSPVSAGDRGSGLSTTPTSPKRLWSRFLKKDNVASPGLHLEPVKHDVKLCECSSSVAKELQLRVNGSALFSSVRVRCISDLCNDPWCACTRTMDGGLEYRKKSFRTPDDSQSRLEPWDHRNVAIYVNEIRSVFMENSESTGDFDTPLKRVALSNNTPGKICIESMSSVTTGKGVILSDYTNPLSGSTFRLEIYSSCSVGCICKIPLSSTTDVNELYSPTNFSPVELFTQSLLTDTLHVCLKMATSGPDKKSEVDTIVGQCEKKITTLPWSASECKFILRSIEDGSTDVGVFYCTISQQQVDTSDSEDEESSHGELPEKKNGSEPDNHLSNNSFGVADRFSKNRNNQSWRDKAISIFKGKNHQPQPSSPLVGRKMMPPVSPVPQTKRHAESHQSLEIVDPVSQPDVVVKLAHPLEMPGDAGPSSDIDSTGAVLEQNSSSRISASADILPATSATDNIFKSSSVDMSDLLGDYADSETKKSISNARPGQQRRHPSTSPDDRNSKENSDTISPKRRSLLKPVKRSSVTAPSPDNTHAEGGNDNDDMNVLVEAVDSTVLADGDMTESCVNEVSGNGVPGFKEGLISLEVGTVVQPGVAANGNTSCSTDNECAGISFISRRQLENEKRHAEQVHEAASSGEIVGVFSETKCSGCGFLHYDEEFMAQWASSSHSLQSLSKTNSMVQSLRSSTLRTAHIVKCSKCSTLISPTLSIKCYSMPGNSASSPDCLVEKWSRSVLYLSPFCLRLLYEHLVHLHGYSVLEPSFLLSKHPDLFWCLRWYSKRMSSPIGFISSKLEEEGLIIVGLHESTVRNRAFHMLCCNLHPSDPLSADESDLATTAKILDLYFPAISSDHRDVLAAVSVNDLDGTTAGMRRAILKIYPHIDQIMTRDNKVNLYTAKARNLYTCILILCHCTLGGNSFLKCCNSSPLDIEKGTLFDVVYPQTLVGAMSNRDMSDLRATQSELLSGVDTALSKTIRVAFGFLP